MAGEPFITAKVTGDAVTIQKLGKISTSTQADLIKTTTGLAIEMVAYVKSAKLSGQVLKNRTGTLRRSITHQVRTSPGQVFATVGTNVRYARPHEFGWSGKVLITKAFGKVLKYPVWKSVNLPERSFLRSSLKDKADRIRERLIASVARSVAP